MRHDISAGVKAKIQASAVQPIAEPGVGGEAYGLEATHNVTVRLPVSLDDRLEEFLFHVNRAARTVGKRALTKRQLIELAIRELVDRAPGEVLG